MPQMANRIQETTTTGGTGTLTLAGAVTGYLTFAAGFSTGASLFYTIDNGVGEWEIGIGTLVTTGTLSRVTVIASSNGGALVNFGSGTKRVFCSAPTRSLVPDQDSKSGYVLTTNGTEPAWTQTLNGITIGNLTAAGGAFTTLSASSTVSGTGFSTYLASPPAIGGTTPAAGAFTTLSASSTVSGTGFSTYLASPPAIGGTTPAAGAFTTLSSTGNTTLGDASGDTLTINAGTTTFAQGTAGGVAYLNGSKVLTTGSALTFDGTNLGIGTSSPISGAKLNVVGGNQHIRNAAGGTTRLIFGPSSNTTEYGGLIYDDSDGSMTYGTIVNYAAKIITNNTERLRIDASGNVGIGTSSPGYKLDVNGVIATKSSADGGAYRLLYSSLNSGSRSWVLRNDVNQYGDFAISTSSTQTGSTWLDRVCIDSSGNLGLGVTPSAWSVIKAIQIGSGYGSGLFADNGSSQVGIASNAYYSSTGWKYFATGYASYFDQFNGQHRWLTAASGTAGSAISFTQAMTLDASGNLLVGQTSTAASQSGHTVVLNGTATTLNTSHANGTASTTRYHAFYYNATEIGYIYQNGTTNVGYSTSSDYRLKENVQPIQNALSRVVLLKPSTYTWKSDKSEGEGFIAHELQEVVPQAVSGEKDGEDMQGVDYGKLTPLLAAAIQELTARLETLEQRIN